MADNLLYYSDNLDVLCRHVSDESMDLVYLDPRYRGPQGAPPGRTGIGSPLLVDSASRTVRDVRGIQYALFGS